MKRTLSLLKKIALIITFLCTTGMIITSAAQYFDPIQHWTIALLGLGFMPLLLMNIFLLIFWIIVRIRWVWIPLIGLVAALPGLLHVVSFNVFNARSRTDSVDLRIMTYNVRNFDLYNWSHEQETRRKMMSLIGDEQPDVACFQEFFTQDAGLYNNVVMLTKNVGFKYKHVQINSTTDKIQHWGIATFSNYPIVNKGLVQFPMKTNNSCIYTDIDIKGNIVRVYNVHLQSVYLTRKDYAYIEDFQSDRNMKPEANQRILTKLKEAYQHRAKQVSLIRQSMQRSPYPVILCGDFNDTPVSFTYRTFTENLSDCFLEKGWGISSTYTGPIPLLRIDYVLHDTSFTTQAYRTVRQAYTDHYPVIAELTIQQLK